MISELSRPPHWSKGFCCGGGIFTPALTVIQLQRVVKKKFVFSAWSWELGCPAGALMALLLSKLRLNPRLLILEVAALKGSLD